MLFPPGQSEKEKFYLIKIKWPSTSADYKVISDFCDNWATKFVNCMKNRGASCEVICQVKNLEEMEI